MVEQGIGKEKPKGLDAPMHEESGISRRALLFGAGAAAAAAVTGGEAKSQVISEGEMKREMERLQGVGQKKVDDILVALKGAIEALSKPPYDKMKFIYRHNMASMMRRIVPQSDNRPLNRLLEDAQFTFDPFLTTPDRLEEFLSLALPIYAREDIAPPLTMRFLGVSKEQLIGEGFTFFGTGRCFLYSNEGGMAYQVFDQNITAATFELKGNDELLFSPNDGSKSVKFRKRGGTWAIVQ